MPFNGSVTGRVKNQLSLGNGPFQSQGHGSCWDTEELPISAQPFTNTGLSPRTALTETLNTKMLSFGTDFVKSVLVIREMNQITRRQVRAWREGLVQCWSSDIKKKSKNSPQVSSWCIYLCHCASPSPYTNFPHEQGIPLFAQQGEELMLCIRVFGTFGCIYDSAATPNWNKILLICVEVLNRLCNVHTSSPLSGTAGGGEWC